GGGAGGADVSGGLAAAFAAVSGGRLVLVFGNAGADNWRGAGRGAVDGGPLQLPAQRGPVDHGGVGDARLGGAAPFTPVNDRRRRGRRGHLRRADITARGDLPGQPDVV